ncbi:MAG: 4Fe-4S binding protein, partial [Bacillota bacterium]
MLVKNRKTIQILFLALFILLMLINKAQIWMGFIFVSIILAKFFGRYYCGFACPINTLMRPASWLGRKLGTQKKQVPDLLKSQKPRWIAFGIFLLGLSYTIYTITQGRKFPLPLIIIPLGLLTTLFINERSWHRYLCPW